MSLVRLLRVLEHRMNIVVPESALIKSGVRLTIFDMYWCILLQRSLNCE